EGGAFQGVEQATEGPAEARPPADDVVEPRKDVAVVDDPTRLAAEEAGEGGGCVGADGGAEGVGDDGRQPVHEGNQPKNVAFAQVDAVRLEQVEPIRGVDDDAAARPEDAQAFRDRPGVVADVLDDLVEHDHVEGRVGIWQVLRGSNLQVGQGARGLGDALLVDVDPEGVRGEAAKLLDVGAQAAPDVQDPAELQGSELADEGEAPVLAEAPDVARMPERDPLRLVRLRHTTLRTSA